MGYGISTYIWYYKFILRKKYLMPYHNEDFGINIMFVKFQFINIYTVLCV